MTHNVLGDGWPLPLTLVLTRASDAARCECPGWIFVKKFGWKIDILSWKEQKFHKLKKIQKKFSFKSRFCRELGIIANFDKYLYSAQNAYFSMNIIILFCGRIFPPDASVPGPGCEHWMKGPGAPRVLRRPIRGQYPGHVITVDQSGQSPRVLRRPGITLIIPSPRGP